MVSKKSGIQNPSIVDELDLQELMRSPRSSPEDYAERAAVEILRKGLLGKGIDPKSFLPHVLFLYAKYKNYKIVAEKIGGNLDDHTIQQWVRVAQAVEQEPEILDYLSEQPSKRTLTVTKAYRVISKFQDAYVSLKVIELMAGTGDREIAEILKIYEKDPGKLSIRKCKELVLRRNRTQN